MTVFLPRGHPLHPAHPAHPPRPEDQKRTFNFPLHPTPSSPIPFGHIFPVALASQVPPPPPRTAVRGRVPPERDETVSLLGIGAQSSRVRGRGGLGLAQNRDGRIRGLGLPTPGKGLIGTIIDGELSESLRASVTTFFGVGVRNTGRSA